MRKENLKRKGVDDAENASDNEDRETSPVADNGDDDAEVKNANDNTEENGDSKEPGTDDEFEDAENDDAANGKGKEADKTNGNDGEKREEDNGEEEDEVPLKKSGRAKPKPAKKAAAAAEGNGDVKANGDGQEEDEKDEGGEEAEDGDEDDAGEDKNDDGSDFESAPKKGKKGAGKRPAPKKKEVKKAAKPKPAKKTKKQEIEEEEQEDEEVEYEVQDIVDHRKERGGKMVYRIRWKNFGAKDDTWEQEATLSCPDIIKRYKAKLEEKEKEDEEEEDVEYEVEDIIDHRKERGGKMVYRIRWKNFKAADDTWEQEATLTCPDIIKRYKAKHEKEDSAPPAKKGKAAPKAAAGKKGAAGKKATPKPSPKKRSAKESDEEDDEEEEGDGAEYEVEKIIDVHFKRNGKRDYLVRWKGFSSKDDTWEPEEHLNCKDLIAKFNEKLDKSKNATVKELRVNRKPTERLHLVEIGRKTSRRNAGKTRVNYYDGE